MSISTGERQARHVIESIFQVLTEDDEVRPVDEKEVIREQALAQFTKELDGKIKNLQEGEYLQITYRIDIVRENGKVRGGSGSQRNMPEYIAWRKAVYERDNYTYQECGARGGSLNAHHIKSWAHHPELRFDVNNGVTLCRDCHSKEHPHLNLI